MDARQLALRCREWAANRKAEDVVVLDLRKLSSITDYFVIATGTSEPHLRAIVEEVTEKAREEYGLRPNGTEGSWQASWVVIDYFDVIVHIMHPDARERYGLEQLWGDAPRVSAPPPSPSKPSATPPGSGEGAR